MNIKNNLFLINDNIAKAAKLYHQNPARVNLIAVSKMVGDDKIIEAINCGCKNFGENYLQEAQKKWPEIKKQFPEVKLHFIGHLQSNKAAAAVELFDVIQSVDSKKLVVELNKAADKQQKKLEIFIQVNIGQEPQKGGVMPAEVKELVEFIHQLNRQAQHDRISLVGLMCIPPEGENPAPYFALLHKLAKENNLENLSMGMSADYEEAIAMQANYIRIGSAIFGKRENGAP